MGRADGPFVDPAIGSRYHPLCTAPVGDLRLSVDCVITVRDRLVLIALNEFRDERFLPDATERCRETSIE